MQMFERQESSLHPYNENYRKVETKNNGDCFYSAYYRLSRIFNSDANLTIFPECSDVMRNEQQWIDSFKQGICTRLLIANDPLLKQSVNSVFNTLFDINFSECINSPNIKKRDRLYETFLKSSDDYDETLDKLWIHPFTETLPYYLNNPVISVKYGINILKGRLATLNKGSRKYEQAITQFSNDNKQFQPIKNKIKELFIKGLNKKNCEHKHAYATNIEVGIIIKYINLMHAENDDIIRISEKIFQSNTLSYIFADEVNKKQFIFYKTSKHYEGMYSQAALTSYLLKLSENETFGFSSSSGEYGFS